MSLTECLLGWQGAGPGHTEQHRLAWVRSHLLPRAHSSGHWGHAPATWPPGHRGGWSAHTGQGPGHLMPHWSPSDLSTAYLLPLLLRTQDIL